MTCLSTCLLVFGLVFASLFTTLTSTNDTIFKRFIDTLDKEQRNKYISIIQQRSRIYITGLLIGSLLGIGYIMFYTENNTYGRICNALLIALSFTYLYYMIAPKTKGFILEDLYKQEQRTEWLNIYKTMKMRHITGFIFGIAAWGVYIMYNK